MPDVASLDVELMVTCDPSTTFSDEAVSDSDGGTRSRPMVSQAGADRLAFDASWV
jgi:hypothetical protein